MAYPVYQADLITPPLTEQELDQFGELLDDLQADGVMNLEACEGFLAGLVLGPRLVDRMATDAFLPEIWGGDGEDGAPFPSGKQRKKAAIWALRHLQTLDRQFREDAEQFQPLIHIAETEEAEVVDAEFWCAGFMHAVGLAPEAWDAYFDRAELKDGLQAMAMLAGDEAPQDASARDTLSRSALDAVVALARLDR